MYKINEVKILKEQLIIDLFDAYSVFEYDYRDSLELNIYLEFFYQIYYCFINSNFSVDEIVFQYIAKYDKFDPNAINILFLIIRNVAKKYGIRMERISNNDIICIQFTKQINTKTYYVDNSDDLQAINKSLKSS